MRLSLMLWGVLTFLLLGEVIIDVVGGVNLPASR